jgi:hypothetical protein
MGSALMVTPGMGSRFMNGTLSAIRCIILVVGAAGLLPVATANAAGQNLVSNPGFEIGSGKTPASWQLAEGAQENTFDWVKNDWASNDVHSGNRSLRMNSIRAPEPGHSMGIASNLFKVPPHSRVETSVWIKASDVVNQGDIDWYGLRVTLTVYDASGDHVEHRDLIDEEGSFAWKKIQGGMIVPEGATAMDFSIKMTTSTGTVWVDDAEVRVVQELPPVNLAGIHNPVLIPRPWQFIPGNDKFQPQDVAVVGLHGDARVREAVESYLKSIGIAYAFLGENDPKIAGYPTQLILGDSESPVLDRELSARFPGYDWPDLEQQGYFLAVAKEAGRRYIYAGANSDIGRFYAIQTLKQLVLGKYLYVADILDKPTVGRRGIAMGLQWFDQRDGEALRRLTQLKSNFVWVQGSFLDDYLNTDNWRLDFTASQKALLKEFIELYQKNFIEVWIAIGPRGKNPPLQYSSDADIDTVVRKMDVLYGLGLRNFGLRFDDLANVAEDRLLVARDIDLFNNDIGAAQAYFINAVYSRLKAIHPDIGFMVVPMDYNQIGNYGDKASTSLRLRRFYDLSFDIGVYAVCYYDDDVLASTCLTGRPTVTIVSNYYAEGNNGLPEYVVPYVNFVSWQNPAVRARIAGFSWLPNMPQSEDAALISWHTAADFAWAPERYDPEQSFQRAVAKYLGVPDGAL